MRLLSSILLFAAATNISAQSDIHVAKYWGDRAAAVSYTFDDGLEEHYTLVFPQLKKLGIKATFAIIGDKVGSAWKGVPCMTWEQLREMAADGQEISNHGWSHTSMVKLKGEAMRHDVQRCDTAIYEHTGVMPRTFVYPGNRHSPESEAFCSKGRTGTRTSQVSIGSKRDSTWLRRWVDGLIASGGRGVGMTHGITCGYDSFGDPSRFWQHLDYVSRRRDSIWIAPLADVEAYVAERDNVKLKIRRHKDKTIVTPRMRLDKTTFSHPLTLVVKSDGPLTATQDGRKLYARRRGENVMIDFRPGGGSVEIAPMEGYRTADGPAPVFLTAGQSNTDGRVYAADMPEHLSKSYRHLHYANVTNKRTGRFGRRDFEENRGRWSYCDVVNHLLDNSLDRDFYSVKAAVGGTAIDTVPGGMKRPTWHACDGWLKRNRAYTGKVTEGRSLIKSLTEGFELCVDSTLNSLPSGYDVKAIMWHQGESDRHAAKNYYENFKRLICHIREAVSAKTGREKDKTLPFIFGTVPHTSRQYSAGVEEAQRRIAAELPEVYCVDLSRAWLGRDNLHFAADWTETIGQKMFNVLVRIGAVCDNEVDEPFAVPAKE